MTLGELTAALEQLDARLPINGDGIDSYRGYYDQASVTPGESTVGDLLAACREALAGEVFHGWKGGEYTYDDGTPVWYAERGDASRLAVIGVTLNADGASLATADLGAYTF